MKRGSSVQQMTMPCQPIPRKSAGSIVYVCFYFAQIAGALCHCMYYNQVYYGESSELIRVLNEVGAVVSEETHARLQSHVFGKRENGRSRKILTTNSGSKAKGTMKLRPVSKSHTAIFQVSTIDTTPTSSNWRALLECRSYKHHLLAHLAESMLRFNRAQIM